MIILSRSDDLFSLADPAREKVLVSPACYIAKGLVFYLCDRVGKEMKPFKMYKFQTMIDSPVCEGQSVCPQFDPRITTFGRFLRRSKLNELP